MSTIFFDTVVVSSSDSTTSRVMLGGSVGNLNNGTVTSQQGLLVPAGGQQNSLPQLTAVAYLAGVPVAGVSFLWESSNPCCCAVDQSGNVSRVINPNASSFDSNGCVSTGQLGGLVQISATALRPDGSPSGVRGVINVVVQNAAPRQYTSAGGANPTGASSPTSNTTFYNLV